MSGKLDPQLAPVHLCVWGKNSNHSRDLNLNGYCSIVMNYYSEVDTAYVSIGSWVKNLPPYRIKPHFHFSLYSLEILLNGAQQELTVPHMPTRSETRSFFYHYHS